MTHCQTAQTWANRIGIVLAFVAAAWGARAADFSDPDWPCVQRKVPELAAGQVWTGPELPPQASWDQDASIQDLAARLAVRRTGMEEVESLVGDFAAQAGADRATRLGQLFAATFAKLNAERGEILNGIARYAHRQSDLTKKIDTLRSNQQALIATPNPSNDQLDQIETLEDEIIWNTRVFKDRQQSLSYVCDTPVIIEQRAFAIAKVVQQHLD